MSLEVAKVLNMKLVKNFSIKSIKRNKMPEVSIGIAGVGDCASTLMQRVYYYR